MAFVKSRGSVVSFAEFQNVLDRDKALFDANEAMNDSMIIDPLLVRATERILTKLRQTEWWREYFPLHSTMAIRTVADIPALNPDYIKDRYNDFTDLCVYTAMSEFILPSVANFGKEDNNESAKMEYYTNKAKDLFKELVDAGDWYDFDGSGVVTSKEKLPGYQGVRFVR